MDENVVVRMVAIGASLFISLMTISAVMLYYNTAKNSVRGYGSGINIESEYRADIKNTLIKDTILGSEVKNLIQYFLDDVEISIGMNAYYSHNINGYQIITVKTDEATRVNNSKANSYTNIMKNLMPNQKFKITKISESQYNLTLIR